MHRQDPYSTLKYWALSEKKFLIGTAVTGLIYNIGMTAGPWFEGQLVQYLADILNGNRTAVEMVRLAILYGIVILVVQGCRSFKRLFVRYYANALNKKMKMVLYASLTHLNETALQEEQSGSLLTKAISDVDDCVEGMRKFLTEIFDTGVAMTAYIVLLMIYDWRLALLSLIFPPLAYFLANQMKKAVVAANKALKKSTGLMNEAVLDRSENALTYRIYGEESNQENLFEEHLSDYERKSVRSVLLENGSQPVYHAIAMISTIFIFWLGGCNVTGQGWTSWNIAAFSTFLACYGKLAIKTSKSAKLFNSIQKASVSWKRIQPFMKQEREETEETVPVISALHVNHLSITTEEGKQILEDITFEAKPGEIIGITGPVASGKSALARAFLHSENYKESIHLDGCREDPLSCISCTGHDAQLFTDTIENNIALGKKGDVIPALRDACMEEEVRSFEDGIHTMIGSKGRRLSGGQQARIALARALYHVKPVLILDDPFASLDQKTEREIFSNLRKHYHSCIILLISHRLDLFDEMDHVLFLNQRKGVFARHEELMKMNETYRNLVNLQKTGGTDHEA